MSVSPSDRPDAPRGSSRIAWIDDARGIGIFLVVVGHVLRGLRPAGILDDSAAYRFVDGWIYAFHMPLFFILSGMFAERKARRDARVFLTDQAAVIVYPYLLWSVLQSGVQIAMSGSVNKRIGLGELLAIPTTPVMQFWFLYALFLIACAHYALRRLGLTPTAAAVPFAFAWATLGLHPDLAPWVPLLSAGWYGIYYALGAAVDVDSRVASATRTTATALTGATIGYALVAVWIAADPSGRPAPTRLAGNLAAALCGSAATFLLAGWTSKGAASRVLGPWGRYSLQIYVAHTIFSAATRIVLIKGFKVHSPAVHVALGTVAGILPAFLLARLAEEWSFPYLFRWPVRRPGATAAIR